MKDDSLTTGSGSRKTPGRDRCKWTAAWFENEMMFWGCGKGMGVRPFWQAEKHYLRKTCWVGVSDDFQMISDFVDIMGQLFVILTTHLKKHAKFPFPVPAFKRQKNVKLANTRVDQAGRPGSLTQGFINSPVWPSISPLVRWRVTRMDRKPPGMFWKLMDTLTTWELLDAWR